MKGVKRSSPQGCEVANPTFSSNELKTIMTIETIVMVADSLVRKKVEGS